MSIKKAINIVDTEMANIRALSDLTNREKSVAITTCRFIREKLQASKDEEKTEEEIEKEFFSIKKQVIEIVKNDLEALQNQRNAKEWGYEVSDGLERINHEIGAIERLLEKLQQLEDEGCSMLIPKKFIYLLTQRKMSKIWKPSIEKFQKMGFKFAEHLGMFKAITVKNKQDSRGVELLQDNYINFIGGHWFYEGKFINITRQSDLKMFIKIICGEDE